MSLVWLTPIAEYAPSEPHKRAHGSVPGGPTASIAERGSRSLTSGWTPRGGSGMISPGAGADRGFHVLEVGPLVVGAGVAVGRGRNRSADAGQGGPVRVRGERGQHNRCEIRGF